MAPLDVMGLTWVWFSQTDPMPWHGGWPHARESHVWFHPRLSSLVLLNIVLVECKKHCFRLQNPRDLFFHEKKHPAGLHHTESRVGMLKCISNLFQICAPYPCMGPFSENHQKIWMTWPLALHEFRKSYPCKGKGVWGAMPVMCDAS